ncbi:MAG TPA: sulfite exporter TauE/SafE family protein [Polyangiaceae bacterium]
MFTVALVLALLIGVALGLLGGGGSILTLPILRYALEMDAHEAIATSLFVVGTTSIAALIPHARAGNVRWKTGLLFGLAGMAGAYLAARAAHYVPEIVLLIGFSLMMFATALAMLRRRRLPESLATALPPARKHALPKVLVEGLVVGAVTGLVGAGGGFLVVPALVLLGGLPMPAAVGTSLLVIAMKSLAGFAGFVGHTPIAWPTALLVSGAAVLGSVGGAALAGRIPPRMLRTGFGWFVVAMAFFLLAQELPALWGGTSSAAAALLVALLGTGALALFAVSLRFIGRAGRTKTANPALGTDPVTASPGGNP